MISKSDIDDFIDVFERKGGVEAVAAGVQRGANILLSEIEQYRDRRQKQRFVESYSDDERYLNVGGGPFLKENWRVLDFYSEYYDYDRVFIDYDINLENRTRWSIETGSYDLVYTSHTLEHLTDESMQKTLEESYRILKPGGVIRINVPDIDLAIKHYEAGTMSEFNQIRFPYRDDDYARARCEEEYVPEFWLLHFFANHLVTHFRDDPEYGTIATPSKTERDRADLEAVRRDWERMERVEFLDRYKSEIKNKWHQDVPNAHRNWFNFDRLNRLLADIGFQKIERGNCLQSRSLEMCTDEFDKRPAISVLVEAEK